MKTLQYKASTIVINEFNDETDPRSAKTFSTILIIPHPTHGVSISSLQSRDSYQMALVFAKTAIDREEDRIHRQQTQGDDPNHFPHMEEGEEEDPEIDNEKIRLVSTHYGITRGQGSPQSIAKHSKQGKSVSEPSNVICSSEFPQREDGIKFNEAEMQSGLDRVRFAELLIKQLPEDHEGRNTWLLNYGTEQAKRTYSKKDGMPFHESGCGLQGAKSNSIEDCMIQELLGDNPKSDDLELLCSVTASKSVSLYAFLHFFRHQVDFDDALNMSLLEEGIFRTFLSQYADLVDSIQEELNEKL